MFGNRLSDQQRRSVFRGPWNRRFWMSTRAAFSVSDQLSGFCLCELSETEEFLRVSQTFRVTTAVRVPTYA